MEAVGRGYHFPEHETNSIRQSVQELSHLSKIFWEIENSTDFWKAVHKTLESLKKILQFENGIVYIYDSNKHAFNWQKSGHLTQAFIHDFQGRLFETIFYYVISDKRPLTIDYSLKEIITGYNPMEPGHGSCLSVPIIENQQAVGILILEHLKPRGFNHNDLHMAMLYANHIGFSYHRLRYPVSEESLAHRYHNLFERISVPLFYCSPEGALQYANQAFLDLLELRDIQEAVEIDLFNRIHMLHHQDMSFQDLIKRCGFFKNIEAHIEKDNGQSLSVLLSIIPLRDEKRNVTGFEGVLSDISEKRDLEAQLLQAQKLGALGSLTGGIAHDFNNLISGIMGCASMLLTEISDKHPFYSDIVTIMNASRRAADLTGQLLSFTRKHHYEINDICTATLVEEVVGLLSHTLPKNISIITEIEPDVHPMHADSTQMQQALMNICINARDAMPEGGTLTIKAENIFLDSRATRITRILEAGPYVLFRIKDTGSGMDKDLQDHIFEPFFTTKSDNQGSGLGLAIVADIVQKHRGTISVRSEMGQGSMFEMLIPAGLTEEQKENMVKAENALMGGKETLLLVDDEEVIRRMSKRMLEKFGYHVLLARDGLEAIEIYKNEKVDLLIIDMIMPKLDGFRTLQQLKTIDPDVRAVLFTGNITAEGRTRCMEAGFYDLVTKPFETTAFLHTVRHALDD